jgi:hypothetical protein
LYWYCKEFVQVRNLVLWFSGLFNNLGLFDTEVGDATVLRNITECYQPSRLNIQGDYNPKQHCPEKLRSQVIFSASFFNVGIDELIY